MSRRTLKKLLLSLIAIGALASITTGGTYAVLQGRDSNPGSVIQSGTLTMGNTVSTYNGTTWTTGSMCVSNSGLGTFGTGTENENTKESSPASAACGILVPSATTLQWPGVLQQVRVAVQNTGSVDAKKLYIYMPGASAGAGCVASASTVAGASVLGGNPCGASGDLMYVEEDTSGWSPISCAYPAGAGACSISGGGSLNDFSTQYYAYVGHKLDLGNETGQSVALKAQHTRYFVIGLQEGTGNTLQGETATFSLTWHLDGQ